MKNAGINCLINKDLAFYQKSAKQTNGYVFCFFQVLVRHFVKEDTENGLKLT